MTGNQEMIAIDIKTLRHCSAYNIVLTIWRTILVGPHFKCPGIYSYNIGLGQSLRDYSVITGVLKHLKRATD